MYNFYLFALFNTFLSASLTFLKQDILTHISISEEILFSQLFLFMFFVTYYFLIENRNPNAFVKKLVTNEQNITYKLLLFDLCLASAIIVSGYILMKENIIYSKPIKIGGYLILISLISYFYKNTFTYYDLLGIISILVGICFIEYGKQCS